MKAPHTPRPKPPKDEKNKPIQKKKDEAEGPDDLEWL